MRNPQSSSTHEVYSQAFYPRSEWPVISDDSAINSVLIMRPEICPHRFPHPSPSGMPSPLQRFSPSFIIDSSAMQEGDKVGMKCEGIKQELREEQCEHGQTMFYHIDTLILARYALLQSSSSRSPHFKTLMQEYVGPQEILEVLSSQIYGRHEFLPQEFSFVRCPQFRGEQLQLQDRGHKGTKVTLDRVFMCKHNGLYKCM